MITVSFHALNEEDNIGNAIGYYMLPSNISDVILLYESDCIATRDSINVICMRRESGPGIALCPTETLLNHHAEVVNANPRFSELMHLAK